MTDSKQLISDELRQRMQELAGRGPLDLTNEQIYDLLEFL